MSVLKPPRFISYEIQPILDLGEVCEVCAPELADFWSVYGKLPNLEWLCIGDFSTKEGAEFVMAAIKSG